MGNALKNKNIGLVTYSNSDNYFRQNWLDVLRNEFDNFFHLELDMNFNIAQKQKVISGFIKDNNLDLLIITIGHSVFHPAFYHNLNVNLLFYFTDDDWTFDMRTRFMCQYANIVVTPNQDLLAKYKPYNRNVFHMTWAGNPYLYKKINCEKKYDVTSIGGPHSDRYEVLKFLRDNGVNLRIFGRGWNRYPDMKDIWGGYLAPEDLVKTINQSKINLSFLMASIMDRYHITGRFFEIPCAGGFQLCDDYFEVYKYYKRDSAISTFSTKDDLLKKIHYYLKNEEEREEIAQAGYERTMEEYTWNKRFENLFKAIDESGDEVFKMPDPYISKKTLPSYIHPKVTKLKVM
jgi:spore maturation protein CgeB